METRHLVRSKEPHGPQNSMLTKCAVDTQGSWWDVVTGSQREQASLLFFRGKRRAGDSSEIADLGWHKALV